MDTPRIQFLAPTPAIAGYDRALGPASPAVPRAFADAMAVREAVFVREQGVAPENELDADDARSCHWVAYDTTTTTTTTAATEQQKPIGTLRLVPSPHPPHPEPGGVYYDGRLTGRRRDGTGDDDDDEVVEEVKKEGDDDDDGDRPTSLHDGRKPYVKLGRLAVAREFRGRGVGGLLVRAALRWMREHPAYFDAATTTTTTTTTTTGEEAPQPHKWDGLVCCHAQEQVRHVWASYGFELDEGMGRWWEEGMPHVGMFQRLKLEPVDP
ncbi:hypothetical protein RB598_009399 [Gaeumannomyces tritici]